MADIETMMNRIAALLAKAESTEFPEEAEAFRTKAEELMRKYRIEEEQLVSKSVSSGAPMWREVSLSQNDDEWRDENIRMFYWIAEHCGVEQQLIWRGQTLTADVVGYEIDIRLVEMIFNSARLAFLARLEPKFDASATVEENIYHLRGSGMDRQRIAKLVFGQVGHSEGIKVGKIFKAECERRGEVDAVSGRGFNPIAYREAYADEFVSTIWRRLAKARNAADAIGGAVVLPQRAERVKDALYAKYPNRRPMTPEEREEARKARDEAAKDSKPVKYRGPTKAQRAASERLYGPASERARAAGRGAAESVDLVRQAPTSKRAESSNRTPLEG